MGRLPQYQSRRDILPPRDSNAFENVATELRGQQAIAGGLADLGQSIERAQIMDIQLKNRNYLTEAETELRKQMDDYSLIVQKEYADNPDGARAAFEKQFGRAAGELAKKAPTDRAREIFGQTGNELLARYDDELHGWKIKKNVENTERTFLNKEDYLATSVYRKPNPKHLEQALKEAEVAADIFNLTHNPSVTEQVKKDARRKLTSQMFQSLLDGGQTGVAAKLLGSKKYDEDLGAEGISNIQKVLNRVKKAKTAKAKDYSLLMLRNPHEYWKKIGMPLSPIDLNNPESLTRRSGEIEDRLSKTPGVSKNLVQVMSPIEEEFFLKEIDAIGPQKAVDVFSKMAEAPNDTYRQFVNQVAVKNPALAAAMNFVKSRTAKDQERAMSIMAGLDLIKKSQFDKTSPVRLPKPVEIDLTIDEMLSGVELTPEDRQLLKQSTKTLYAKKRADEQVNGQDFDRKEEQRLKEAFREGFGGTFVWNGKKFMVPDSSDGSYMDAGQITYALKNINNQALEKSHGSAVYDGKGVFNIDDASKDSVVISPVQGSLKLFYLKYKDKDGVDKHLLNKSGKKFVLNIEKLHSGLEGTTKKGVLERIGDFIIEYMPDSVKKGDLKK